MVRLIDPIGKKFGRLTVEQEIKSCWICRCDCGNKTTLKRSVVKSGNTKSCGCLHRERAGNMNRTHGKANSRITGYASRAYGVWQAMRDRCYNSNRADYHRYGGRGISVCKRWQQFENFLSDMGEPPPGLTLERLNNDKGYSPSNCKWATRQEQAVNRERSVTVMYSGKLMLMVHVAIMLGVNAHTCRARYYSRGWTAEESCGLAPRRK